MNSLPLHTMIKPVRLSHRFWRNLASGLCLLLAIIFFGQSMWIFAKAQVAQVLLERAFSQSIATGKPVKAWSWADSWPVAQVSVKRLKAEAIVLQGGSGEALAFGPALLNETAKIGDSGTSVIAAHRDTHFAFLQELVVGDVVQVRRSDGLVFTYRVSAMRVANWNSSGIDAHAAGKNLVLATCYPFGALTHGPLRYLVEAELVP